MARILVLEDDDSLRLVITKSLSKAGYEVRATASADSAIDRVLRGEADLLVADVVLGDINFLDRINEIVRGKPDFPIIVISAQTTAATAIHAATRGAHRYLPKPFDLDDLTGAVSEALAAQDGASAPAADRDEGFAGLYGRSDAMQLVFQTIGRLARTRHPVLITGPEGSGRAMAARALHEARGGDALTEAGPSRLSRESASVLASGKSVLLRRADAWTEAVQAELLEHLESGAAHSGGQVYVTASSDVMSTLHPSLYQRLAGARIVMPKLRERGADASALFRRALKAEGAGDVTVHADAETFLQQWCWPGEVLELERLARAVALSGKTGPITADRLRGVLEEAESTHGNDKLFEATEAAVSQALEAGLSDVGDALQAEIDRAMIVTALAYCNGVQRDAAERLGWNRNTLARRMKALGLAAQSDT